MSLLNYFFRPYRPCRKRFHIFKDYKNQCKLQSKLQLGKRLGKFFLISSSWTIPLLSISNTTMVLWSNLAVFSIKFLIAPYLLRYKIRALVFERRSEVVSRLLRSFFIIWYFHFSQFYTEDDLSISTHN
jgi:hypothetical protein